MRCNRCGNPMDPRDTRCSVCGKPLPPPKKQRQAPQKPANQKPSESHTMKLPQLDQFTYAYAKDADRGHRMHVLALLGIIVCGALLVLLYRGNKKLHTAIQDLQTSTTTQIQALQQTPVPSDPPVQTITEPDSTEPPVQNIQPLSRQRLKASMTLRREKDRNYAIPAMTLGTFDASPTTYVSTQWTTNRSRTDLSWAIPATADQLDLLLEESFDTNLTVNVQWAFSGDTFAGYGDVLCIWECRTGKSGDWGSISADCFQSTDNRCTLTIAPENMELLLAQYDALELRCLVSLTHPDGGTMSITVDGITVGRQGLVTGW